MILLFLLLQPEEIEQLRTKTAYALDAGEFEIDVVGSFLRFEDGDRGRVFVEAEFGITDWLLVGLEAPYLLLDGEHGIGDVELELKAAPRLEEWPFAFAVGIEVSLLTGNEEEGLGSPEAEFGVFLTVSREFGRLHAHLHLFLEVARGAHPEQGLNLALDARPWGDVFSLLLALNVEFEESEAEASLVPGVEVRLEEPELQVGVGFPVGLTDDAEEWGVIVDVEVEF
jgi:hypothetical protein